MRHMCTKSILFLVFIILLAVPCPAAVPPGRISVYSTPTGALACIDNATCDTTGATFTVEGNAWHTVTVTEKGYRLWSEPVYVSSDQTSMVTAYLDLDPAATAINVTVRPGGGIICLDNIDCRANVGANNISGNTLFTGVSPGYHTLSVEAPAEHEDTSELVQVNLGKITEVSIELRHFFTPPPTPTPQADRETGSIRVYVDRTGSTICLDNADCYVNVGGTPGPGTGTVVFSDVTANVVHIVTIAADGYKPVSTKIVVGKDQVATADVTMVRIGETTITASPTTQPTVPPTMPTNRSGPGAAPVLMALALCGAIFLFRKY